MGAWLRLADRLGQSHVGLAWRVLEQHGRLTFLAIFLANGLAVECIDTLLYIMFIDGLNPKSSL